MHFLFRVADTNKGTWSEDLTFALCFSLFQFFSLVFPAGANEVEGWGRTEEPRREGREEGEEERGEGEEDRVGGKGKGEGGGRRERGKGGESKGRGGGGRREEREGEGRREGVGRGEGGV